MNYTQEDIAYMKKASLLCDSAQCGYKVGCLIVQNGEVLVESWNERLPGNVFCNYGSCVREEENLGGGKNIDRVCSIHAEQAAIAEAARQGKKLENSTMYVSTFPCLICAKSIAKAGISKLFYMSMYMGEDNSTPIFEENNVSVVNIPLGVCWEAVNE